MNGLDLDSLLHTLQHYIDHSAMRGDHISSLTLRYGLYWPSVPLHLDVKKEQPGRCFWQAFSLALARPKRFTYVEGYACNGRPIPVHHAWCVDEEGNVVDPTWNIAATAVYAGVPFREDVLKETAQSIERLEDLNQFGYLIGMIAESVIAEPIRYLKPKNSQQWGRAAYIFGAASEGRGKAPI